jgi:adenylate cyclase
VVGQTSDPPTVLPDAFRQDAVRRQVTILFADLSGFTALTERLDAEEVRAFQSALFEALAHATIRYGGFVDKFMGDAVLAVFGAPVAHENDAERALQSALEMMRRVAALSEGWQARLGSPVVLHIAVHTGPVVAGSLSHAAGAAYEVTGDTVNTASRLLGAATPGTILVSDATHALTQHLFAFRQAGELALRGKVQKIGVHRLLGALTKPQSARGLAAYGLAPPMVGRAGELEKLVKAFDQMEQGHAQVACVIGEAGGGKSRLITEFLGRLETDGRLGRTGVRRVVCSSLGEPTYGVFGALFREAYEVGSDDSLDIAKRKMVAGLGSLGARSQVTEAVASVLSFVLGMEEARPVMSIPSNSSVRSR